MTTATDLTQRHRAQQLLLRKATVTQMRTLWPALDWARLDATYPQFALAVAQLVSMNRRTSSGLASAYLRAFRKANGVPGEVKAVFAEPVVADQLDSSLHSTSVAAVKNAASKGVPVAQAMKDALTLATGSVARMVLDAGRETTLGTIQSDPAAIGWQRILGGGGCDFCRMLAGRGGVYKEATVDFASHDHCGCSVSPDYGDQLSTVKAYVPSTRNISDTDRARVRAYLKANPNT